MFNYVSLQAQLYMQGSESSTLTQQQACQPETALCCMHAVARSLIALYLVMKFDPSVS